MNEKLFGILVTNKLQEPAVTAHCFGDCSKISIGGVIMSDMGGMMVCCEQVCPYVGVETDEPFGTTERGDAIYLRALKRLDATVPATQPQGTS